MEIIHRIRAFGSDHPVGSAIAGVVGVLAGFLVLWQLGSTKAPLPTIAHAIATEGGVRALALGVIVASFGLLLYIVWLARRRPNEYARHANQLEDENAQLKADRKKHSDAQGRLRKQLQDEKVFRASAETKQSKAEEHAAQLRSQLGELQQDNTQLRNRIAEQDEALRSLTPPVEQPQTETERVAVDDVRVLFKSVGHEALHRMEILLIEVRDHIRATNRLAHLLDTRITPLREARNEVGRLLADGSGARLSTVRESFARMFREYMLAVRWYHQARGDESARSMTGTAIYFEWRKLHKRLHEEFERMSGRELLGPLRSALDPTGWEIRFADDTRGFSPTGPDYGDEA